MDETPRRSIQEALTSYLQAEHVQEDFANWQCETIACIEQGKALEKPLRGTSITSWPQTLLASLKRWDQTHGLLTHEVHCNELLMTGSCAYKLHSVVTHVGATPDSGHYVAHRRHGLGFITLNDTVITCTAAAKVHSFSALPEEKVYVAVYIKCGPGQEHPEFVTADLQQSSLSEHNDNKPPEEDDSDVVVETDDAKTLASAARFSFSVRLRHGKRKIIDLDSDDATPQETAPTADEPSNKNGNKATESGESAGVGLRAFTAEERQNILSALSTSPNLATALSAIRRTVPRFTCSNRESLHCVSRSTLRGWQSSAEKATCIQFADARVCADAACWPARR